MADLIDRTRAVDALTRAANIWQLAEPYHEGIKTGYRNAARIVLGLPPVDSVEVVRCICCKYYGEDIFDRGGYCKKHKLDCDDFDFCSRGERK